MKVVGGVLDYYEEEVARSGSGGVRIQIMAGNEGCMPNGRGYSTLAMDHNALFSSADEVSDVDEAKGAGALFVLESKGTCAFTLIVVFRF